MVLNPDLVNVVEREVSGLRERLESLELELVERKREFEEKEKELNWVYQQKLDQARIVLSTGCSKKL